jgi:hypothetical protein
MERTRTISRVSNLLWIVGLLVATVGMAAAQNDSYYTKWINYTAANGFPPGEVYCVTVDGNRVWAGTGHGLVLLVDGRVKKIFTTKDGLSGMAVMSVAVDKQTGAVWIGTFGGLSRYSGGQFTSYTNLSSGLANDLVYGVAMQGQYVWVATTAGVNRLDTYTGTWEIFNESNAPFEEPWVYGISVGAEKVYFAVWAVHRSRWADGAGFVPQPGIDPQHCQQRFVEPGYKDILGLHLFWSEQLRRAELAQLSKEGQWPGLEFHQRGEVAGRRSMGVHAKGTQ